MLYQSRAAGGEPNALSAFALLKDPRRNQGLIVPWRLTLLVCPHRLAEVVDEPNRPVPRLAECAHQPLPIELIAVRVSRLGDPIGVEQNGVAGFELHGGFFEIFRVIDSQRVTSDLVQSVD